MVSLMSCMITCSVVIVLRWHYLRSLRLNITLVETLQLILYNVRSTLLLLATRDRILIIRMPNRTLMIITNLCTILYQVTFGSVLLVASRSPII